MPRLSFALSILVLPFALHSIQAQGQPQMAETKAGTATVSGRVLLKGEPALGVMVILQGRNPGMANSLRAKADESGRFRFTSVAAGVELSPEIRQRFSSVKEKVFVGSDNQKPVTLMVDLSRKEGDK